MTEKIPPNVREKIPAVVLQHLKNLEQELDKIGQLNEIETKTKVPKLFLVLGLGFVFFILLAFDIGGELLSNLVGFAYPAFASLHALEGTWDTQQQQFWLTYWIVFGALNVIEYFACYLSYIPLYFVLRFAFLVWLIAPQTQGAAIIYNKGLQRLLQRKKQE